MLALREALDRNALIDALEDLKEPRRTSHGLPSLMRCKRDDDDCEFSLQQGASAPNLLDHHIWIALNTSMLTRGQKAQEPRRLVDEIAFKV